MKTLDEVIAYFDNQTQQRHVYLTEDAEDIYNDVLHYLRELRYILDNLVWVKPEEKGHWEIRSLLPEDDERTEK